MARDDERHAPFEFPTMALRLPDTQALEPYLRQIDANGWYSNFGPLARSLTARLAHHFSAPSNSVCLMANATLALTAALQGAAERRPGGVCLLPSWTFAGSAHAVQLSGLRPRFIDVDPISGQLTPQIAAAAVDDDVVAVLVVSPFGQRVDPLPWVAFRDTTGLDVVIDAAGAFDTVTASPLATIVSMHATKPLSCGEGAFVLSEDVALVERLRRKSNFGFDGQRRAQMPGLNAKMSEYHAAVALASLDRWAAWRRQLIAVGQLYRARLATVPSVAVQHGWADTWISTTLNVRLAGQPDIPRLCARLASAGVEARSWWGAGCHTQPAFVGCARGPLPVTEEIARKTLGLPFSTLLSKANVDTVVRRLEQAMVDESKIEPK